MVATPVPVGISPHWMDRKGTLTLSKETFLAVVYEICESLKAHGVKSILVLNGHGGNVAPLREAVPEWKTKLEIDVRYHSYWNGYSKDTVRKYMTGAKFPVIRANSRPPSLSLLFPNACTGKASITTL